MTHTLSATLVAVAATGILFGCSGPAEIPPDPIKEPAATDSGPAAVEAQREAEWACIGQLVPPTGWEQHTAFVDEATPNAEQVASDKAREQLVDRICGDAPNCDPVRAATTIWKTGKGRGVVCSMAVIEAAEMARWRRANLSTADLDTQLHKTAGEILEATPQEGRPTVAIGRIFDEGVAGGKRAEWLKGKMEHALSTAGANVRAMRTGWAGVGVPSGVDVVVSGATFRRNENHSERVEVIWEGRFRQQGGVAKHVANPVSFPLSAGPGVKSPTVALPPNDPNLMVRVDTRPGGSLCAGDESQAWLYSTKDLHVRVIDLYGKDGAIVLFPNADHPDDRINANETLALGPERGFQALPVQGSEVERFLILAAANSAGLGRFENIKGYCRLPHDIASKLHRGEGIPAGVSSASDGFRILSGGACPSVKIKPKEIDDAISATPQCH